MQDEELASDSINAVPVWVLDDGAAPVWVLSGGCVVAVTLVVGAEVGDAGRREGWRRPWRQQR